MNFSMNKIFITLLLFSLISCEAEDHYNKQETIYEVPGLLDVKIYEIDSCQYIGKMIGNPSDFLTHKGNCKYCSKRSK